jgi:hypothetical protein
VAAVLVQSVTRQDNDGVNTVSSATFVSALTAGSKIIVVMECGANTTVSITDTAGNSYTVVNSTFSAASGYKTVIAWADNTSTTASNKVTSTWGATGAFRTAAISEWTGLATGAPDVSTVGQTHGGTATPTDASMTTTVNGDLIISAEASDGSTVIAGSGYTLIGAAPTGVGWEYQVQSTAGAIAPAFNISPSAQGATQSVAFKASGGAAPASDYAAPWQLMPPGRFSPASRIWNPAPGVTDVAATPVAGTDAATGADAATLATALTGTDTGAGANAATLATSLTGTDVVSGADGATLATSPTGADTGTGTDAGSLTTALTGTDTAAGTDSATLSATVTAADTGASTDAATLSTALTAADTGTAVDAASVVTGLQVNGSDTGSGTDAAALTTALTSADTAAGADTGTLASTGTAADTGSGANAASLTTALSSADTADAADAAALATTPTGSDTGSGVDTGTLAAALAATDTGTAADSATVQTGTNVTGSDTAHAADAATVMVLITTTDNATAADLGALAATVAAADLAHALDVGAAFSQSADPNPANLTLREPDHTDTIRETSHTTAREPDHWATVRETVHATVREAGSASAREMG